MFNYDDHFQQDDVISERSDERASMISERSKNTANNTLIGGDGENAISSLPASSSGGASAIGGAQTPVRKSSSSSSSSSNNSNLIPSSVEDINSNSNDPIEHEEIDLGIDAYKRLDGGEHS